MRSSVLTVCALALATSTAGAASNFSVVNGEIIDPSGNQFIAHGVNIPGQNFWTGHDPSTASDVHKLVDDWNFNMVRVDSQALSSWSAAGANINLDNIVNAYTAKHVVVMIDTQESTGTYFQGQQLTDAANWYASLAAKYKNNPYVWFNTGNEPGGYGGPDATKWLTMNQTIISAIRNTGAQNMVVADGTAEGNDSVWEDYGTLNKANSAILSLGSQLMSSYSNVAFDLHTYGMWLAGGSASRLSQYLAAAKAANIPVMIGEYGATTDGDYQAWVPQMLAIANQYGVGRLAWNWADAGDWDLTTGDDLTAVGKSWEFGGGYMINSDTNPSNLTAFGQMVWGDTHLFAPIPEPTTAVVATLGIATLAGGRRRRSR